jgi:hypothetical protein|tara:strand:- start:168 stop:398 length:231 start_codon:yes stop_codon:yes gene_type:complete
MYLLILTNILLVIVIVFLFAIYKDLNSRVFILIEQLGRKLDKLDSTVEHIKRFILMNEKEKEEVVKMIEKGAMKKK